MAIAIKAIPTLYGEDAIRFRSDIERVDMACESHPDRDITKDPRYVMILKSATIIQYTIKGRFMSR